jgi:hypothetical protein
LISVIVAFPKPEIAKSIRNVLVKNNFDVRAVATTGSQALRSLSEIECGILVCGYRFRDMMYDEIAEYMPDYVEMLLVASKNAWEDRAQENIVCLSMPLKVHELVSTVEMMSYALWQKYKKDKKKPKERTAEERELIVQAKQLLMERNHMSEEEAHRYIQKTSMDSGSSLTETAQKILSGCDFR